MQRSRKLLKNIGGILLPILIGVVVALLIRSTVFEFARVDGPSMQPNLQDTERVAMLKLAPIHRNSVVIFDAQGEDPNATSHINYVKRVVGLPGDEISSRKGRLYVNGKQLSQAYIGMSQRTTGTGDWTLQSLGEDHEWAHPATRVPKDHYFVLGDHRSVSNDSRYWGFVDRNKIAGVVKVPFWTGDKVARHNINRLAQK
ncbi:signal peptidase I [Furfurilactobacillus siliginis]|nr:signal peptidase I [Furfurilactobacillus siliginis]